MRIIRDDRDKGFHAVPISSQTVLIGDLLELTAGATTWTVCTSSSNFFTRKAIAVSSATTADTEVDVVELDGSEDVSADSANTASAADNGDRMALTDKNTVNNSGTDVTGQAVAFLQRGILSNPDTTTIWGNVLVGNGVDPDAA